MITALDLTSSGYRFYKENLNQPYCDGGWYKTIRNKDGLKMYQIGFYFWTFPGNNKVHLSCETTLYRKSLIDPDWSQIGLEFSVMESETITAIEDAISALAQAISTLIPDPINN